tara:strand:+ start:80 stop:382 length:303 start_codon:yes stop_codon:yes gene_type:complete
MPNWRKRAKAKVTKAIRTKAKTGTKAKAIRAKTKARTIAKGTKAKTKAKTPAMVSLDRPEADALGGPSKIWPMRTATPWKAKPWKTQSRTSQISSQSLRR